MAEPARRLNDPYDDAGNEESLPASERLHALEGGGETTPPKRGHLKSVGADEDLAEAEENPESFYSSSDTARTEIHESKVGQGYAKKEAGSQRSWIQKNRKKLLAGGSLFSAMAITAIVVTLLLAPFKILHIVNNLQSHFFSNSQSAVDKTTNKLFAEYFKKYIVPGLRKCKAGHTTKNCVPAEVQGNTYVSKLYKSWRNDRLEKQLAENYGLEFERHGNKIYMKSSGLGPDGIELDDNFLDPNNPESFDEHINKSDKFKRVSRAEARAAIRSALDNQTRYSKVMYHFKVGRLLEEKYGIRRCIVFCKATDNFEDWKGRKKDAAKAYIIDRIITPRSASLSIVLGCILAGTQDTGTPCTTDPGPPPESCSDGVDCTLNGEAETGWERDLRGRFANYRSTFGSEKADKLLKEIDEIRKHGYWVYLYNKALEPDFNHRAKADNPSFTEDPADAKIFGPEFSKKIGELTQGGNIFGALNTLSNMLATLGNSPKQLHKLTYVTNAATMVTVFSTYRTYADEIKTGHVDAQIVGSFTQTLNSGIQDDGTNQVGGKAGAEEAPLYQTLIDNQPVKKTTAGNNSAYHCGVPTKRDSTDKPIAAGKLVCDEENLTINHTADEINGVTRTAPLGGLISISEAWKSLKGKYTGWLTGAINWTFSKLGSFVNDLLSLIPGYQNAAKFVERFFDDFMQWLVLKLIPSPIAGNSSGGRMFDAMAGGADVAGNDYAHTGLGGRVVSGQESAAIRSDQQQLALAEYHNQPLMKRLLDTDSDYSPAAKIALHLPSNMSDLRNGIASSVGSNFISKMFSSFSNLFSLGRVNAADAAQPDPFGVTQYGYTDDDIKAIGDPEAYWQANCAADPSGDSPKIDLSKNKHTYQWNAQAAERAKDNGPTYMPISYETNPCLLIQAAVGSAGGVYDSSLLTQDDTSN